MAEKKMDTAFIWITLWLEAAAPLDELHRFPSCEDCHRLANLNRKFQERLDKHGMIDPKDWRLIDVVKDEARVLYCIYGQLADAKNEALSIDYRLERIRLFRDVAGDRVFYGIDPLPSPLPLWRLPTR